MSNDRGEAVLVDSVNLNLCRELADLEREKAFLEEKTKLVKAEIEKLNYLVYPQLVGRKSQNLEDGIRLQPKRSLLISKRAGVSTQKAVEALQASEDLAWLVREDYQSGKLREHIKELDKAAMEAGEVPEKISDLLPEELNDIFQIIEKKSVVVYGVKNIAKAEVMAEERRKEVDRGERQAD